MKKYSKAFIAFLIIISMLVGYVSAAAEFTDVKEADWFAEAVGKLNGLKIIDGMPDGSFSPQGEVTRAQFVKMLVEAMSYKHIDNVSFVDMRPNPQVKPHWASVYVETALRNGAIVKEEEGDRFYPDIPLTRDDMVMMICRALKLEPSDGSNPYFDMDEPNGYFTKVYEEYLIRGIPMNGKIIFNSTGVTTRAQASVIISRLVDYRNDPKGFIKRMAMEERFASGTETPEDITLKREMEIKKALSDPDYIMEPIITVEHNTDPWTYKYFRLYFENEADYSDDATWKLECTNYKQLNTYEMPKPNGTFVKRSITIWRPLGSIYKDSVRTSSYTLGRNYYTTQALIKDFPIYAGMKIEFKITVKKENKGKVIYETVTVNDIKFKD